MLRTSAINLLSVIVLIMLTTLSLITIFEVVWLSELKQIWQPIPPCNSSITTTRFFNHLVVVMVWQIHYIVCHYNPITSTITNQWREIQMQYNNIIINNKTVMKVSLRTQIVTVMPEIMELRKVECLFSIAITVHLSIPQMEEGLR